MTNFRSWRTEAIVLAFLLPLVVVLGLALMRWPQAPAATSPTPIVASPTASTSLEQSPAATPVTSVTPQQNPATTTITVEIKSPSKQRTIEVPISGSMTVAQVLLRAQADKQITLDTQDYGGSLGLFVKAIDGLANDNATQMYWQLYVNDKKSALGASSVNVSATDQISWRFQKETKATR